MTVISLPDDESFNKALEDAGQKLVVVDFYATWCGPCLRIAPKFEQLSTLYGSRAVFLKIDVDKCQATAMTQGVTAMPTFIFYRNKTRADLLRGGDPAALEAKVKELLSSVPEEDVGEPGQGNIDLAPMINKSASECLNESDEHPFLDCITSGEGYLESDVDEQLIISLGFIQPLKLHSIKVQGPADSGPKTVKLFINHPNTLDFDQGTSMEPTQLLELKPEDLSNNTIVPLRFVKFQNVQNLQIVVLDNQKATETTRIDHLAIYGRPVCTTNMSEFKRVAGKKGESH